MSDVRVTLEGHVATLEICRGPNNFFDFSLVQELADQFAACEKNGDVRCILLCTEGKNFCAGANFGDPQSDAHHNDRIAEFYKEAVRLFRCSIPIVAAVQGAAVGGGLGLALVADLRVGSAGTRFTANFNRLGFHPGFGLSVTLPRLVGMQQAALMLYTGRRIDADEARRIGLLDVLSSESEPRSAGCSLAAEIAGSAPLAVAATRRTLREGLADAVARAVDHELAEQARHFATDDFREGLRAMQERREPAFAGR